MPDQPPSNTTNRGQRRYDLLLAGIPVVFCLTYLLGSYLLSSGPLTVAAATLTSSPFLVDALYRHPPTQNH